MGFKNDLQNWSTWVLKPPVSLISKSLPFSVSLWLWCRFSASGELWGAGTRGNMDKMMLSVQVALPY